MDINNILEMLDWNNDIKIQKEGLLHAEKVKCLNVFIQPMDKLLNKNIWDNCALVISSKEDELLVPYLPRLLDWIQDMNCPGSIHIFDRLRNFKNYEQLSIAISERIIIATALKDEIWLSNLEELSICEELKNKVNEKLNNLIPRIIE